MIDDMIQEYQYMDRPLKYPRNPEPSPITSSDEDGSPAGKFWPTRTRTRIYGCGIPVDTGVGSRHSRGFSNGSRVSITRAAHRDRTVQNGRPRHTVPYP